MEYTREELEELGIEESFPGELIPIDDTLISPSPIGLEEL
jgi:hypothetical protein